MKKRKYDRNKTREKVNEKSQYNQARQLKKIAKELRVPLRIKG